jgi:hypothetical protein
MSVSAKCEYCGGFLHNCYCAKCDHYEDMQACGCQHCVLATDQLPRPKTEDVTALDVVEGDVIYMSGYRCRVSDVKLYPATGNQTTDVARYTLRSEPDARSGKRLPTGYEGMRSGGNHLARVAREIK